MAYFAEYDSPVGKLLLRSNGSALTGLWIGRELPQKAQEDAVVRKAVLWLDSYFRGEAPPVTVPVVPEGTAFQMLVWELLQSIPYGETRTYGELAREAAARLGREKMSAQAVGQAVGSNPISILIPCHRVVGAKGQMTGYAWGIEKKIWLLSHEKKTKGDSGNAFCGISCD